MATLSAGGDVDLLAQQAVATRAPLVAVASASREEVTTAIGAYAAQAGLAAYRPEVVVGDDAAVEAARTGADVVLNGITGSIGLRPTLAALESGAILALANKESLIVGGPLVKALARPGQIVPWTPSTRRSPRACAAAARRCAGSWSRPAGSLPRAVARGAAVRHS